MYEEARNLAIPFIEKLQEAANSKLFDKQDKMGGKDKNRQTSKLQQKSKKDLPRVGQDHIADLPDTTKDFLTGGYEYSLEVLVVIGILFAVFYIFVRYLLGFNMFNNYVVIQE